MGDENTVTVALVNNQLKVSTTIYASDGKAIAVIKNSQWVVNPNKVFTKNFDSKGFEVIDDKNFVAISVDRKSPKDIYINGVFRRKGSILVATDAGSRPFPKSQESTEECEKQVRSIKKIFKYTGNDYIGKREKY